MQQEQEITFNSSSTLEVDDIFNMLPVSQQKKEIDPNEDKYIIYAKQIDTKTIKRVRVRITPAVCLTCGLDLVKLAFDNDRLNVDKYEDLPEKIQEIMKQALIKHNLLQHSNAESLILSKSELPKQWLDMSA